MAIMTALFSWPNLTSAAHCFVISVHVRAFAFNRQLVDYAQAGSAVRVAFHMLFLLAHAAQRIADQVIRQDFLPTFLARGIQAVSISCRLDEAGFLQRTLTFGAGFHRKQRAARWFHSPT